MVTHDQWMNVLAAKPPATHNKMMTSGRHGCELGSSSKVSNNTAASFVESGSIRRPDRGPARWAAASAEPFNIATSSEQVEMEKIGSDW